MGGAGYPRRVIRMLLAITLLLPGVAFAQVSVNSGALDRLQPSTTAPAHKAPAKPASRSTGRRATRPTPSHPAPAHAAPTSSRASKLVPGLPPAVPAAPPGGAVLTPPVVAPVRPLPPPAPVPVVPEAGGAMTPIKGGIRISFGAGSADMNQATQQAVRSFAGTIKGDPNADLNLYAFAAGVPDDPSTPRRLSLARALAIRAILIGEGIVSTRIYPRALGASPSPAGIDGPPDRVDLLVTGMPAATP